MTSELIHSFAHELRSHLRTASTRSQLLERSLSPEVLPARDRLFLGEIVASVSDIDNLLKSFTRYIDAQSSSSRSISKIPLDVAVRGAYLEMKPRFTEAGGEILINDGIPNVRVPSSVQGIVSELLTNSLKFRCHLPPKAVISGSMNDNLLFSVEDNGTGIDPSDLPDIFQPFKRLHSKGAIPGYGLGLATCYEILTQLSGKIEWSSAVVQGSVFTCTMPSFN